MFQKDLLLMVFHFKIAWLYNLFLELKKKK